jgi:hypothetical protein
MTHPTSTRRRGLAAATVVLALGATAAITNAATPSEGTVSNSSPTVEWTGTLAEGAATYNAMNNNPDAPCAPPSCDTFALTVADGGPLTLTCELGRTGSSGDADCGFRITDPSGATSFTGGTSGPGKPYTLKIKNAAKGDYTVDVTDSFIGSPGGYTAKATLGAASTPAPAPPTTPTPPPSTAPAPQPQPGTTISIATRSASAKKLRKARKLGVSLRSSAPVHDVKVTLKRGSKTLASGKLARMASSGKVTLKLKGKAAKLKPGSYRLIAAATDDQGRPTSAGRTLKVKK